MLQSQGRGRLLSVFAVFLKPGRCKGAAAGRCKGAAAIFQCRSRGTKGPSAPLDDRTQKKLLIFIAHAQPRLVENELAMLLGGHSLHHHLDETGKPTSKVLF
jgi:hypothetical protein